MRVERRSTGVNAESERERNERMRRANVRTALVLLSIALVFFVGVIATRFIGSDSGIAFLGTAVLLFLALAIGRNLRKNR